MNPAECHGIQLASGLLCGLEYPNKTGRSRGVLVNSSLTSSFLPFEE